MPKRTAGYRNKNTGRLHRNTIVQTVSEDINFHSQYYENAISISIQTIQTKDRNTEFVVECSTLNLINRIYSSIVNVIRGISNHYKIRKSMYI